MNGSVFHHRNRWHGSRALVAAVAAYLLCTALSAAQAEDMQKAGLPVIEELLAGAEASVAWRPGLHSDCHQAGANEETRRRVTQGKHAIQVRAPVLRHIQYLAPAFASLSVATKAPSPVADDSHFDGQPVWKLTGTVPLAVAGETTVSPRRSVRYCWPCPLR